MRCFSCIILLSPFWIQIVCNLIIPIIQILEKNKKIKKILLTSSTKSSALIYSKYKLKKTIHIYYPIDQNNLTKSFINYCCIYEISFSLEIFNNLKFFAI